MSLVSFFDIEVVHLFKISCEEAHRSAEACNPRKAIVDFGVAYLKLLKLR